MLWILYAAIGVVVIVILYLAFGLWVYRKVFGRGEDPCLDEVDLTGTHYEPYRERLYREISVMRARESREVTCTTQDGTLLAGDYYANKGEKLAVLVHGYKSKTLSNFSVSGNSLFGHGYDLLMIHQRAYGRSGGKYTAMGEREQYDVLSWLDWVKENTAVKEVILYGVSMGGYTVACVSDKVDGSFVKAIVDDCGYTSPCEELKFIMKKNRQPYPLIMPLMKLYAKILMRADFKRSASERLSHAKVPVMFIHGKRDGDVPVSCALENYEACVSPKELCLIEEAGHTASFLVDASSVEKQLYTFLEKIYI